MRKELPATHLDHFILSVLRGDLASKLKYAYYPWLLWPKNIDKPQIDRIHEPKLPYPLKSSLVSSLARLSLSINTTDLKIIESAPPDKISTKHVVVYQSNTEPTHILRVSFNQEPTTNLFHAHQLLCFIMGDMAFTYYQAELRK